MAKVMYPSETCDNSFSYSNACASLPESTFEANMSNRAFQPLESNTRLNEKAPSVVGQAQFKAQQSVSDQLPRSVLAPYQQQLSPDRHLIHSVVKDLLQSMNDAISREKKFVEDLLRNRPNTSETGLPDLNARGLSQAIDELKDALPELINFVDSNPVEFRFAMTKFLVKVTNVLERCGRSERGWIVHLVVPMLNNAASRGGSHHNGQQLLHEACTMIRNIAPYLPSDSGLAGAMMANAWTPLMNIVRDTPGGSPRAYSALECILRYIPIQSDVVYKFSQLRIETSYFYSTEMQNFRCTRMNLMLILIKRLRNAVNQETSPFLSYDSAFAGGVSPPDGSYSSEQYLYEVKVRCATYLQYLIKECRQSFEEEEELGVRDLIFSTIQRCRIDRTRHTFTSSSPSNIYSHQLLNGGIAPSDVGGQAHAVLQPVSAEHTGSGSVQDSVLSSRMRANWLLIKKSVEKSRLKRRLRSHCMHQNTAMDSDASIDANVENENELAESDSGASSSIVSSLQTLSSTSKLLYRDFVKWTAWCRANSRKRLPMFP